jgi:hypothetical protein
VRSRAVSAVFADTGLLWCDDDIEQNVIDRNKLLYIHGCMQLI